MIGNSWPGRPQRPSASRAIRIAAAITDQVDGQRDGQRVVVDRGQASGLIMTEAIPARCSQFVDGVAVTAAEAVGPMVRDYAVKDVLGRAGNGEESLFGCRFIDGLLLKAHTLHSRYRTIFALARRPSIVTNTVVYRVGVLLSIGAVVLRRALARGRDLLVRSGRGHRSDSRG